MTEDITELFAAFYAQNGNPNPAKDIQKTEAEQMVAALRQLSTRRTWGHAGLKYSK